MCLSWCFGSAQPADDNGELPVEPDVPFTNKLCVGFAGLLAWGISIPICYYHNAEIAIAEASITYTCPYINSLGATVDIGRTFIYTMQLQFWVYLCLSILVMITLFGAYCAKCRCFNALLHSLGLFAHIAAIAYLGAARFSQAGISCSSTVDSPLYEGGTFLYDMFII